MQPAHLSAIVVLGGGGVSKLGSQVIVNLFMLNKQKLRINESQVIRKHPGDICDVTEMHSAAAAAPSQGSGAKRRCISSLQVTYHQEIHKPAPQLVNRLPPVYVQNR